MRVKALKRQVDEAEEECSRINAQKRRVQRDLDEQMEQTEILQRENEQMKSKMRTLGADRLRWENHSTLSTTDVFALWKDTYLLWEVLEEMRVM